MKTVEKPRCQARNQGTLWIERKEDKKDTVLICSKIEGPSTRFRWKEVRYAGSLGKTNGPELVDGYGATWDGYSRVANTWAEANSLCTSLGGRLPTLTELLRNAQSGGSGPISNYFASTSPLWTSSFDDTLVNYYLVSLTDGATSTLAPSSPARFRCIWAYEPTQPFTGTNCYGTFTENCQRVNRFYNVDRLTRPTVTFNSATYQCHQNGGSLPTLADIQNWAVQSSSPSFSAVASQLNEITATANKVSISLASYGPTWSFAPIIQTTATLTSFLCMGKKPETPAFYDSSAPCNGGCFEVTRNIRAPVVADSISREPASWDDAHTICASLGGKLPDWSLVNDLMAQGWIQSNQDNHWTTKLDLINTPGNIQVFRGLSGNGPWAPAIATIGSLDRNANATYRCVWTSTVLSEPVNCGNFLSHNWKSDFTVECLESTLGNVSNNQNPESVPLFADSYGYSWDTESRTDATFAVAKETCENLGGRLPVIGEVFRVSTTENPTGTNVVLPGNEDNIALWTLVSSSSGSRVTITQSGVPSTAAEGTFQRYRCLWPRAPFGDAFGSHKCFGAPQNTDRCFRLNHMIFDRFDRPRVSPIAAAQECAFLGGRLPTFQELQKLILNGAPFGFNGFPFDSPSAPPAYGLWVLEPGVNQYLAVRWSGTGTDSWEPIYGADWSSVSTTVSVNSIQPSLNGFRCLFSDEL